MKRKEKKKKSAKETIGLKDVDGSFSLFLKMFFIFFFLSPKKILSVHT